MYLLTPFFVSDMFGQHNISITAYIASAFFDKTIKSKELFHVCEKFAMVNAVSISYAFTFIINSVLECYIQQNVDVEMTKDYIINYSVLFIWNIYQLMTSNLS